MNIIGFHGERFSWHRHALARHMVLFTVYSYREQKLSQKVRSGRMDGHILDNRVVRGSTTNDLYCKKNERKGY